MVFESIVVDLINKYLGDFVENLDKSQLKLGIWGGRCAQWVGYAIIKVVHNSSQHVDTLNILKFAGSKVYILIDWKYVCGP